MACHSRKKRGRILDKVGDDENVVEMLNSYCPVGHARCVVRDQQFEGACASKRL